MKADIKAKIFINLKVYLFYSFIILAIKYRSLYA